MGSVGIEGLRLRVWGRSLWRSTKEPIFCNLRSYIEIVAPSPSTVLNMISGVGLTVRVSQENPKP